MREVDKRIARLEARFEVATGGHVELLRPHHGEDPALVEERWLEQHSGDKPPGFVHCVIFGSVPDLTVSTRESIERVLPGVKWFFDQIPEADRAAWRRVAATAGFDLDEIVPEKPVSDWGRS